MERAAIEEKKRKLGNGQNSAPDRKRPPSASQQPADAKRIKLDNDSSSGANSAFLASFDFTSLPASLITELIVANLSAFSETALAELIQTFKQTRGLPSSITAPAIPSTSAPSRPEPIATIEPTHHVSVTDAAPQSSLPILDGEPTQLQIKAEAEPVDPLKMDIDQEEIEYEPDRINEAVRVSLFYPLCILDY
jgi:symplekin